MHLATTHMFVVAPWRLLPQFGGSAGNYTLTTLAGQTVGVEGPVEACGSSVYIVDQVGCLPGLLCTPRNRCSLVTPPYGLPSNGTAQLGFTCVTAHARHNPSPSSPAGAPAC